jgi:hypothetical protein
VFSVEVRHFLYSFPASVLTLCLAEDVLGDLGVRQAMRKMPKNARL